MRTLKYFLVLLFMFSACDLPAETVKQTQSDKAQAVANSISFVENAEIDNIKRRLELTSHVAQVGFIILLNDAGQPVMYTSVKGKVTSGGKRLTPPDRANDWGGGTNNVVRAAPSDEGTYGSSGEYVYFWTTEGQYIQWNGSYLYSDKPFRLKIEPLVINAIN